MNYQMKMKEEKIQENWRGHLGVGLVGNLEILPWLLAPDGPAGARRGVSLRRTSKENKQGLLWGPHDVTAVILVFLCNHGNGILKVTLYLFRLFLVKY